MVGPKKRHSSRVNFIFFRALEQHMLHAKNLETGNIPRFYCQKCDYGCSSEWLLKQHFGTKKHRQPKSQHIMLVCPCGKKYRHKQSFRRHGKSCPSSPLYETPCKDLSAGTDPGPQDKDEEKQELRDIIRTLVDQNRTIL